MFAVYFSTFHPLSLEKIYFVLSQRIQSSGQLSPFQQFPPKLPIMPLDVRCRYSSILSHQSCKACDLAFHPTEVMVHTFNCQWLFIFPNNSRKRSVWEKKGSSVWKGVIYLGSNLCSGISGAPLMCGEKDQVLKEEWLKTKLATLNKVWWTPFSTVKTCQKKGPLLIGWRECDTVTVALKKKEKYQLNAEYEKHRLFAGFQACSLFKMWFDVSLATLCSQICFIFFLLPNFVKLKNHFEHSDIEGSQVYCLSEQHM